MRCRAVPSLLLTVWAMTVLLGCAYYNTFYNARSSFDQAMEIYRENPDNPTSTETELLEDAIKGCGKVLRYYPDSKWADDAQLLMGDALYQLGRRTITGSGTSDFKEAMRAYSATMVITDDPRIRDRANLGMGRAAMALERYGDAAAALESVTEEDEDLYIRARLLMADALIADQSAARAIDLLDTLPEPGQDSLRAEVILTMGQALRESGQPARGAQKCMEAGRIFERGRGYYNALTAAAEAYIEAGNPSMAAQVLEELLSGYRSDLEMARISLLRGKAREASDDVSAALAAYRDASERDPTREIGAEALYLRARLLESQERLRDALSDYQELIGRPGSYLWIRLAENRSKQLELLLEYMDELARAGSDERENYLLLISEKRRELYGDADTAAVAGFESLLSSSSPRIRAYAMAAVADIADISPDSSRRMLVEILDFAGESDLAGRIEERLGLPSGEGSGRRPSVVLERAWDLIESDQPEQAWEILRRLAETPWSHEARPAILWALYVASEAARKDDSLVESYIRELAQEYPLTEEGMAALEKLGETDGEGDDEGE